jgi:hypothetical protein
MLVSSFLQLICSNPMPPARRPRNQTPATKLPVREYPSRLALMNSRSAPTDVIESTHGSQRLR